MLHVALVHNHVGGPAGGGGGVRQMLELGQGLRRLGHRVTVVCDQHEPSLDVEAALEGLEIRALRTGAVELPRSRSGWLRRQWRLMPQVARLIPADVDVINAHEWPALHAGVRGARSTGAPLVWCRNDETIVERALMPAEAIVKRRRPDRRAADLLAGLPIVAAARRADTIVVLDEGSARMVRRVFGREPTLARSGPAAEFFSGPSRDDARRALAVPSDRFLLLAVGILMPHRRFEDLIDAVAELPEAYAHIVGSDHVDPAYCRSLETRIAALGLGGRITLDTAGPSDETLRALYAAADLFVHPTRKQTWGLAPLEALAAGTPVVLSSGVGAHDALRGRPGVTSIDPCDPAMLASVIRRARDGGAPAGLEATAAWMRRELANDRYAGQMVELFGQARAARHTSPSAHPAVPAAVESRGR